MRKEKLYKHVSMYINVLAIIIILIYIHFPTIKNFSINLGSAKISFLSFILIGLFINIIFYRKYSGEYEKIFEGIFRDANDGLQLYNNKGQMILINPSCLELLGIQSSSHVIGKNIFEDYIVPPEFVEDLKKGLNISFEIEIDSDNKINRVHKINKGNRYLTVKVSVIGDNKLDPDGYLLHVHDITEQKYLEDTVGVTEKLSVVGQLAGGLAHDFNNQLMGIKGSLSLIRGACHNEKCNKHLDCIERSVQNATSLVSKLLTFSHKEDIKLLPVNMNQLLEHVVELLEKSFNKKVEIKVDFQAKEAIVLGDQVKLENALLNIILNAKDAIEENGLIEIKTLNCNICQKCNDAINGKCMRISISDNGMGMTEDIQKHIFEPFFTTKRVGKGTGLGLSMMYRIIQEHGGHVKVNSIVNKGSEFVISLPVINDPRVVNKAALKKKSIMIVDDEHIIRGLVGEMLETLGHKATLFSNAKDALDYYNLYWKEIDLVILDVIMPDISGSELCKLLMNINPNIKVAYLTGYNMDNLNKEEIRMAAGVISKPINLKELKYEIDKMIDED